MQETLEERIYERMLAAMAGRIGVDIEQIKTHINTMTISQVELHDVWLACQALVKKGLLREYNPEPLSQSRDPWKSQYFVTTPHQIVEHKLDKRQS